MFWAKWLFPSGVGSVLATFSKAPARRRNVRFSGFRWDALGWAAKAAQTADTGATGCDWRFGCAINLCFQ